eukprot:9539790-Lingulodinium_polyedra.AAC.1
MAKSKMELLRPFAASLCAQKGAGDMWDATTLKANYLSLKNYGCDVTPAVLKFVTVRALQAALDDGRWDDYARLLQWKNDPNAAGQVGDVSVRQLCEQDAKDIQHTIPVQHVLDMVRPAANADKTALAEKLVNLLRCIVKAEEEVFICEAMKVHFGDLWAIAVPEEHLEDDRFKTSKGLIETDPKHTFHKMASFPVVAAWMQNCNSLIKQQGVDATLVALLPSLQDLCEILLQQEEIVTFPDGGTIQITEAAKYQGLFSKAVQIKAGASKRFLAEKCAPTLEQVTEVQSKLKEA